MQLINHPDLFDEKFSVTHAVSAGGRKRLKNIKITGRTASSSDQYKEPQSNLETVSEELKAGDANADKLPMTIAYLTKKNRVEDVKMYALSHGLTEDELVIDFTVNPALEEACFLLAQVEKAQEAINTLTLERDRFLRNAQKEQRRINGGSTVQPR